MQARWVWDWRGGEVACGLVFGGSAIRAWHGRDEKQLEDVRSEGWYRAVDPSL